MGLGAEEISGLTSYKARYSALANDAESSSNALTHLSGDISSVNRDIQAENAAMDQLEGIITQKQDERQNIVLTENPENFMYGVQEFVLSQGMCGMGMGMGSFDGAHQVSLTGEEASTLSQILGSMDNGGTKADKTTDKTRLNDILTQLKAKGVDNASIDGNSIVFTHTDGSSAKVFDTNGNGALDSGDYNFNGALQQFQQDMTVYQKKLSDIDAVIADKQGEYDGHEHSRDSLEARKAALEARRSSENNHLINTDAELSRVDNKINEVYTNIDTAIQDAKNAIANASSNPGATATASSTTEGANAVSSIPPVDEITAENEQKIADLEIARSK